jgi:hypothetical protein
MSTAPFSKIEAGLNRVRVRRTEWKQVLAHAKPGSEQEAKARAKLESLDAFIAAESALLDYLRRRWRLYMRFPGVELPADLAFWYATLTLPPGGVS